MDTVRLLKELIDADGPSGYEAEIRSKVGEWVSECADDVRSDALGNLIAFKSGEGQTPRPGVMLTAHMDEIGLMVTNLEKGFLRVAGIGGVDRRILIGQEVVVHGRRRLPGVVVSIPPHFTDPSERNKSIPLEELFIDTGLAPLVNERLVRVGDVVTMAAPFTELAGARIAAKAVDDRAGIAAIIFCLHELRRVRHRWDVFFVATVQEEETGSGAVTSTYSLTPSVAVAVDATFGKQPDVSDVESFGLDSGPTIAMGPNVHPKLFDILVETAKAAEIPHQIEPIPGNSGTDAWKIQISRCGVPTAILGIPVRNMHTPVETVAVKDIERTGRLLTSFVTRLDDDFLTSLTYDVSAVKTTAEEV